MPKLWDETIEAHRREVRAAILHTTAALVSEHGLRSVTMSRIAEEAGIGRATLYRYFPGIEEILHAWHERHVAAHLDHLVEVRDRPGDPSDRLGAVLEAYALIVHHRTRGDHDPDLAAFLGRLHRGESATDAQQQLHAMIRDLLTQAAEAGQLRDDSSPDELATYCLAALGAARSLPSEASVRRLVTITLRALHATTEPRGADSSA